MYFEVLAQLNQLLMDTAARLTGEKKEQESADEADQKSARQKKGHPAFCRTIGMPIDTGEIRFVAQRPSSGSRLELKQRRGLLRPLPQLLRLLLGDR